MSPVMSDQQGDSGRLGGLGQPQARLEVIGQRLLHQHGQSGGHALQAEGYVQTVRGGDDDSVRLLRAEHRGQVRVPGDVC